MKQNKVGPPKGEPHSQADPMPTARPSPNFVAPDERFVSFEVGSKVFCIPANEIAEISHPLPVVPLPRASSKFLGISSLRGNIVAVADPAPLVGESVSSPDGRSKFIVLRSASFECPIVFAVEKMRDIISSSLSDFQSVENDDGAAVVGTASRDGEIIHFLDPAKIRARLLGSHA